MVYLDFQSPLKLFTKDMTSTLGPRCWSLMGTWRKITVPWRDVARGRRQGCLNRGQGGQTHAYGASEDGHRVKRCETYDSLIRNNVNSSTTVDSDAIKQSARLFSFIPRLLSIPSRSNLPGLRETNLRLEKLYVLRLCVHCEWTDLIGSDHFLNFILS